MAYSYDKDEIKNNLTIDQIFDVLSFFGADPKLQGNVIVCTTICHNHPGEGSNKLYYYDNTKLFRCYTDCGEYFDIYQLIVKIKNLQNNEDYSLFQAVSYVANRFGFSAVETEEITSDWRTLNNYDRIKGLNLTTQEIELKEYDSVILDRLAYPVIYPWRKEGITQEVIQSNRIGYYPKDAQITIPHYDENGRFIGLRVRSLVKEDAELYGKYRPARINNIMYNHPLGFNLYGLDKNKENIRAMQKAILFEGEKSVLLYSSYFGESNNISVASCGSSLSSYQFELLLKYGAKEIVICFDKQFKEIGDKEYQRLIKNLTNLNNKYKNYATISFCFDKKNNLLRYKDAPIDRGADIFLTLFKQRVII